VRIGGTSSAAPRHVTTGVCGALSSLAALGAGLLLAYHLRPGYWLPGSWPGVTALLIAVGSWCVATTVVARWCPVSYRRTAVVTGSIVGCLMVAGGAAVVVLALRTAI
jgi:hypothetical protein